MAKKTYKKRRQTGKSEQTKRGIKFDRTRKAKAPGKRNPRGGSPDPYYEYRVNRSDLKHDSPRKRTKSKSTKKWGKVGAPGSAKRKAWMAKIRAKRKK